MLNFTVQGTQLTADLIVSDKLEQLLQGFNFLVQNKLVRGRLPMTF
jgi:hypothetical protein